MCEKLKILASVILTVELRKWIIENKINYTYCAYCTNPLSNKTKKKIRMCTKKYIEPCHKCTNKESFFLISSRFN